MTLKSRSGYFNCKCYLESFNLIKNSYKEDPNLQKIHHSGGRASGKSMFSVHCLVFFLPEHHKDEAIIITYSNRHKINSAEMVEDILCTHGYNNFKKSNISDGDIIYHFGNANKIRLISLETNMLVNLLDKCKNVKAGYLKFVVYEELTATLSIFRGDIYKFYNAVSSFNRYMDSRSITIYNYNPPKHKAHIIYDWIRDNKAVMLNITTTIYDLPVKWQSKMDLKEAERLKEVNFMEYEHQYLGKGGSSNGLAFNIDKDIWTLKSASYQQYYIQTDEATRNATTFSLFGITSIGEIHYITNYYHSSKEDGVMKSFNNYADEFKKWYEDTGLVGIDIPIVTDSLQFAVQLREKGFKKAQHIGKIKNRELSYSLASQLIIEKQFKIVDSPENIMMYDQLSNAEIEYNKNGKAMVSKKLESGSDNKYHFHAGDTLLYLCLRIRPLILRGRNE